MDTKKIKEDIQLLWLWLAFLQKSFDLARTSRITENYLFLLMLLYMDEIRVLMMTLPIHHIFHFPISSIFTEYIKYSQKSSVVKFPFDYDLAWLFTWFRATSNRKSFPYFCDFQLFYQRDLIRRKNKRGKVSVLDARNNFSLFNPFFFPLSFHPHGFVHNQLSSDGSSLFCWCYFFPLSFILSSRYKYLNSLLKIRDSL